MSALRRIQELLDIAPHPLDLSVEAIRAEVESGLQYAGERFFIDSLTATGELYMIPSSRRMEWQAFDVQSEETAELLPVPEWARPVEQLSHVEFEMPVWVFK